MEEGAAKRLIQIGIRTMTGHQREQANKFGVEVIEMRHLPALDRMKVDGPIYISFDMDALDPAFAPGISHREPGGMSVPGKRSRTSMPLAEKSPAPTSWNSIRRKTTRKSRPRSPPSCLKRFWGR
jgi:hypothetical protein